MSVKYDEYLNEHIRNVKRATEWLFDHGIIKNYILERSAMVQMMSEGHDCSKRDPDEYRAYDLYFYGKDGKDERQIENIDEQFDYAWLHHIHRNKHHWQHWVLIQDDGEIKPLEMPVIFMYEMIADWWSFSWKSGDLSTIFKWYEEHKDKMKLHENTRQLVEGTLQKMKKEIDIVGTIPPMPSEGITELNGTVPVSPEW